MNNRTIEDAGFQTCDIGIAAFLLSHQVPMSGIDRERNSLIFVFNQPQKARQLADQFMVGNDSVSARALLSAGKHLRRLVRDNL